jgi:hypothetical protein
MNLSDVLINCLEYVENVLCDRQLTNNFVNGSIVSNNLLLMLSTKYREIEKKIRLGDDQTFQLAIREISKINRCPSKKLG